VAVAACQRSLLLTEEQAEQLRIPAVQERAKELGVALDFEQIVRVVGMNKQIFVKEISELRERVVDSTNAKLTKLLHAKEPSREDAIVLLSCSPSLFRTPKQFLVATVQDRAQDLGVFLDDQQMVRVVDLNDQMLVNEISELRERVVDSTNARLTSLLHAKGPSRKDSIVLLACSPSLFRTPRQFLMATVRDRAQELGVFLDDQQMARVVDLNEQMFVNEISELRELFVDSTNARLTNLLRAKEPGRVDSIVLLSCGRDLLRTQNQILIATVQEQARQLGVLLDPQKIARVIGLSEQMIVSEMEELCQGYVDSTNEKLTKLLQAKNSTHQDSILLLSCGRDLFRTAEHILIATVQDRAKKLSASLDPSQLELVVRLTFEQIADLGREMQKRYAGSINADLTRLLKEKEPSREDFMVLLSCERSLLCLTRGEFLVAGVKERAKEMGISLDTEELTRLVLLDVEEIRVEMVEFRQRCLSSNNVKLAELLKIEEPVAQDSVLLLSCKRELTNIRNRCIVISGSVTLFFVLGLITTLSHGGWGSETCLVATLVSGYLLYSDFRKTDGSEFTI
jgi:hypothetical protein